LSLALESPSLSSHEDHQPSGTQTGYPPACLKDRRAARERAFVRIAALVVEDRDQHAIFAGLAREIAQLAGAASARVSRYQPDGASRTVGRWSGEDWSTAKPVTARITLRSRDHREPWGDVVVTGPLNPDARTTILGFMRLVASVIANIEARQALIEARERVVRAADRVREEVAEQLRAGPRQRLVHVAADLAAARAELPTDRMQAIAWIRAGQVTLTAATAELQELAHGVHPMLLTARGLDPALESLAANAPHSVSIIGRAGRRLAETAEVTGYYVVQTALRQASREGVTAASVSLRVTSGTLHISVATDASGRPSVTNDAELLELSDRVVALGGQLTVAPSPAGGSTLRVRIPSLVDV
jgi:signal transduction histidine kinase